MSHKWYLLLNGKEWGPYSDNDIKQMAATGELRETDGIRSSNTTTWMPASKIKGLAWTGAHHQPRQLLKTTGSSNPRPRVKRTKTRRKSTSYTAYIALFGLLCLLLTSGYLLFRSSAVSKPQSKEQGFDDQVNDALRDVRSATSGIKIDDKSFVTSKLRLLAAAVKRIEMLVFNKETASGKVNSDDTNTKICNTLKVLFTEYQSGIVQVLTIASKWYPEFTSFDGTSEEADIRCLMGLLLKISSKTDEEIQKTTGIKRVTRNNP